ncbi:MAG TPA: sugar phosphate nucleotidyltransferase [Thermoanaerobaculia bacterium]|nr:sugar phosphate nucleotidyltransferase [Thermoanaerobaculia bacterium]
MKGMVLAAGFGTRFRPVTYEIPKPMVPLCNRPLIAYAIEPLLSAGCRQIVVNLHHLPATLERYLLERYEGRCDFEFSFEPEILGTGGGIRKVREFLRQGDDFLLVNGDTVQFPDFEVLRRARRSIDALAALTLRHPPEGDRFTKVFFDEGRITGFGSGSGETLMFSGSHCISSKVFEYLPDRDFSGITEDVYIPVLRDGTASIAGIVNDGLWFDIGTPLRYMSASRELLAMMAAGQLAPPHDSSVISRSASLVSSRSQVEGTIDRSVVGENSRIGSASVLSGSAIWDHSTVMSATLEDSIVAGGVDLPRGTKAKNAMICRRIDEVDYDSTVTRVGDLCGVPIDPSKPFFFE